MNRSDLPLASIGISTYNRADGYLREALESAVRQRYANLEIIVSDNASTDDTEGVVHGFGDPRIRYHKQPRNLGANGNFNFCLEQARGDYFLLLHDDDLIDDDFIETCMAAVADRHPVGLIRTGTRIIDALGRVTAERPNEVAGSSTAELFLGWFDRKTAMYFCSTMYNTEWLREAGGFGTRTDLFQDVVAVARLSSIAARVDIRDVKASFRKHGTNNGSQARVEDWCEDSLYLLDVICTQAPDDADLLRREGLPYFTRTNYRHASSIPSSLERMAMYWRVYRMFEYSYSPIAFLLPKQFRRLSRSVSSRLGPA
jgi:glycosyltransferase involved in cell wall biosynthesis